MSKSLSNGTLSLRFMQNAHRAKHQAQVEAEQAKVKDDAEWEISQEVRDAWGIGSSSSIQTISESVTHESSYMPFIFPHAGSSSDTETQPQTGSSQVKGRRKFNKRGQEVAPEDTKMEPQPNEKPPSAQEGSSPSKNQRPVAISGFQAPLVTKSKDKSSKRTKTVQMLIREDSGRGLREPPPIIQVAATTSSIASIGFMKPAGVDAPVPSTKQKTKSTTSDDSSAKRGRELDTPREAGREGKKRKKVKEEVL